MGSVLPVTYWHVTLNNIQWAVRSLSHTDMLHSTICNGQCAPCHILACYTLQYTTGSALPVTYWHVTLNNIQWAVCSLSHTGMLHSIIYNGQCAPCHILTCYTQQYAMGSALPVTYWHVTLYNIQRAVRSLSHTGMLHSTIYNGQCAPCHILACYTQ